MSLTRRWERATEWPLMVAALAFLAAYATPIINPHIDHDVREACDLAAWITWGMFGVDYLARLLLAEDRKRFFVRHLLDLAIIALPLLRPLRLLRLAALLKILNRKATTGLQGRVAIYVGGGSALMAFCGALAVLDAERHNPEANITTFGDAIWWALTTMSTVGYGDHYPVTGEGRLAAVALMIGGVTLLGVVTATLASWLVQHVTKAERQQTEDLRIELRELRSELQQLISRQAEEQRRLAWPDATDRNLRTEPGEVGAGPGRTL